MNGIDGRTTQKRRASLSIQGRKTSLKRFGERWKNPKNWFDSNLEKVGECLYWKKFIMPSGYGLAKIKNRKYAAHRLAWIIKNGDIANDIMVLHRCNNKPCCNVDHLYLGTHQDNMDQAKIDGLFNSPKGLQHYAAKLNHEKIYEIIDRVSNGETQSIVAKHFGLNQGTVSRLVNKKRWLHLFKDRTQPSRITV